MPSGEGTRRGVTLNQSELVSLMVELFAAIRLVSGYPSPAVLPEVHSLPQVEIQRRLCDGRPCRVKAYEIQNRYLSGIHASRRAFVMGWNGKCADDDEETLTRA